ncbi:MAG: hypothetical protein HQL79_12295 [Magnetococcales bacterium]|nr:hypothetical protein [Magnetococcales bacterium]
MEGGAEEVEEEEEATGTAVEFAGMDVVVERDGVSVVVVEGGAEEVEEEEEAAGTAVEFAGMDVVVERDGVSVVVVEGGAEEVSVVKTVDTGVPVVVTLSIVC